MPCGRSEYVVSQQRGEKSEELSFEEFREVLSLVKPNVATGRDNIPGTIVRFLPESVLNQLYRAIVDRLSGREDAHVHSWAEFDICMVPKKGDISRLCNWRPISLVPTLYKVYEMCMWKFWTRSSDHFRVSWCLDIVSFLVEALRKADEWEEKLFVVSMDVASAFDSVSAQVLGRRASGKRCNGYHCGGCCEGEFGSFCETVHGIHKEFSVQSGSGNETRRPKDSFGQEPGYGSVG